MTRGRVLLAQLCVAAFSCLFAWAAYGEASFCPEGLTIDQAKCGFIKVFTADTKTDSRITTRFKPQAGTAPIRSFALLVGVDHYKNFREGYRDLPPARHDMDNLFAFLARQKFNEIIVLRNDDVSKENIEYFLDEYLPYRLRYYHENARVVFIFVGHGAPKPKDGLVGSLVLAGAEGPNDSKYLYRLDKLAPQLKDLAVSSHHFLGLLGSCFSGGVFPSVPSSGDNGASPNSPGAHVVTAADADRLAYGLGGDAGSVFVDDLIRGVDSGLGDTTDTSWAMTKTGDLHQTGGGIVRLAALTTYISTQMEGQAANLADGLSQIRYGKLDLPKEHSGGAFFFLGPERKAEIEVSGLASPVAIPDVSVPTSSVPGHPDIKVFNAPDTYPVAGLDVSHWNGTIRWDLVKKQDFRFAYVKATQGSSFVDPQFKNNWEGAAAAGLARGAYHVFNACQSSDAQLKHIIDVVPLDPNALPPAIVVESLGGYTGVEARLCGNIKKQRGDIGRLAEGLRKHYGKPPIVHGPGALFASAEDKSLTDFPIWLRSYAQTPDKSKQRLFLPGEKSWSLWQYAAANDVEGINMGLRTWLDVFSGSPEEFDAFRAGKLGGR